MEAQHYRNLMEINSSELTKKLERTKEQLNLMEINSAELTKELERTKEELIKKILEILNHILIKITWMQPNMGQVHLCNI